MPEKAVSINKRGRRHSWTILSPAKSSRTSNMAAWVDAQFNGGVTAPHACKATFYCKSHDDRKDPL